MSHPKTRITVLSHSMQEICG